MSALHPRQIKNFLLETIGKPKELKVQRNGDMLIITINEDQTRKLIDLKTFCNIPVEVTTPSGWNCCQGVINGYGLHKLTPEDILECAEENDRIIAARHFTRINKNNNNKENSNTVILTFDNKIIPEHVYIGFERFPVSQYIMKPLRCFNCQAFGHHVKKCNKERHCGKCNSLDHDDKECQSREEGYKCHNCMGNHTAWSKDCPKYSIELKVCEYKTKHDVSFFEARQIVIPKNKPTWAKVAAIPSVTVETQTYISFDPKEQYKYNHKNEELITTAFLFDKSWQEVKDDKNGSDIREKDKKAYEKKSKPAPQVSTDYQSDHMSSDTEDYFPNKPQFKPPTPMRNYTPRSDYSDRNFKPEYQRPNMSHSPPFKEPHERYDERKSKNRRMMTQSEIEEEEWVHEMMRQDMADRQNFTRENKK